MITISLTTEDVTKVRICPSPLWETVQSFGALLHRVDSPVHSPWVVRARRVLPGTDLSALVAAMCVDGHCPDFLSPRPALSAVTFDEELERLRLTAPEVVVEQVRTIIWQEKEVRGRLHPDEEKLLRVHLEDPEGSVKRLVDDLARYHELAVAPHWSRIREHLEGDTLRRGQALALGGVELLFSGLNPRVGYDEGGLTIQTSYEHTLEAGGRGVTLIPSVFSWPNSPFLVQPHSQPTLAYGPRGVATLWNSTPPPKGTALEAAMGAGRSSVLKNVLVPRTTTEISQRLRLSPAAVSSHLSRLKAAGLVEPHRNGKRVYYRLSHAGESLLGVFGELG